MTWTTVLTAIASALWLAHHGDTGIDGALRPAAESGLLVLPSEPTSAGPAASQPAASSPAQ